MYYSHKTVFQILQGGKVPVFFTIEKLKLVDGIGKMKFQFFSSKFFLIFFPNCQNFILEFFKKHRKCYFAFFQKSAIKK